MAIRTVAVRVEGKAPLLQHRWSEKAEEPGGGGTRPIHQDRGTPREQAEEVAYRTPEGDLYLPGAAIGRLLREAGGSHKQKGSRKSLKYIVPAAVLVNEDVITLSDPETGNALIDFEVDSRPVTIPATKGRIMRHRPRLDAWAADFTLEVNTDILDVATIHQLLVEGGTMLGVGDYRPEKGGPFGRFQVTGWVLRPSDVVLPVETGANGTNGKTPVAV